MCASEKMATTWTSPSERKETAKQSFKIRCISLYTYCVIVRHACYLRAEDGLRAFVCRRTQQFHNTREKKLIFITKKSKSVCRMRFRTLRTLYQAVIRMLRPACRVRRRQWRFFSIDVYFYAFYVFLFPKRNLAKECAHIPHTCLTHNNKLNNKNNECVILHWNACQIEIKSEMNSLLSFAVCDRFFSAFYISIAVFNALMFRWRF